MWNSYQTAWLIASFACASPGWVNYVQYLWKKKRELVTNAVLLNVLNCAHTPGLLGGHAPPVLIAELDAPVGAQSN